MTAKEFVLSKFPKAKAEKHKTNSGRSYSLIRNGRDWMYMSEGDNESKAWTNAKKIILEREKNNPVQ